MPGLSAILLNDTRVYHHGCMRVMSAIEAFLGNMGSVVVARAPVGSQWQQHPDVIANTGRARLVLVNGEGTIHHDRPAGRVLLEAGRWAKRHGIPAVVINAGWEANGADFLELLKDFSLVAVRDSRSAAQLQDAGISCRVVPDLSLYGAGPDTGLLRGGIAFTDSVVRQATLRLDRARCACGGTWLPIQSPRYGASKKFRFMRGVLSSQNLRSPITAIHMRRVQSSLRSALFNTPAEFIEALTRTELLVSGRFHACALALVAGTPFVAIPSNTAKIAALVEDAGLRAWRANSSLEQRDLMAARSLGWEAGEREAIAAFLHDAHAKAEALFADIRRLM